MERKVGTVVRGIRCPIIREHDDLVKIVTQSVLEAAESESFKICDRDVIAVTESVVARAQGNYIEMDDIAKDVARKFQSDLIGVIFPILSRNRFSTLLKGIARGTKKIILMLSYPSDEVGNALIPYEDLDAAKVNPYTDVLDLARYRDLFGYRVHEFTGIDYVSYYEQLILDEGCDVEIIFANDPRTILEYTDHVLHCDIHTRQRTRRILEENGAQVVYSLEDIMRESIDGSGYNETYGLLGANKSSDTRVKLFPRDCFGLVREIQEAFLKETGKLVEVMVFGDGAFKDPLGKIWELADPTVAPAFTAGLSGTPSELKLKYLADNDFKDLSGAALKEALSRRISEKDEDLVAKDASLGTTPRRIVDLLGSLCDLTTGSGDKGTPVVHIQGYFDNYVDE